MDEEKKKKKEPKGFQPIGSDRFLNGLPMRFMTLEEWRMYPEKLRRLALKIGLFEVKYD